MTGVSNELVDGDSCGSMAGLHCDFGGYQLMTDIIERAEAELRVSDHLSLMHHLGALVPELVSALKAARADNERLLGIIDHIGWPQ